MALSVTLNGIAISNPYTAALAVAIAGASLIGGKKWFSDKAAEELRAKAELAKAMIDAFNQQSRQESKQSSQALEEGMRIDREDFDRTLRQEYEDAISQSNKATDKNIEKLRQSLIDRNAVQDQNGFSRLTQPVASPTDNEFVASGGKNSVMYPVEYRGNEQEETPTQMSDLYREKKRKLSLLSNRRYGDMYGNRRIF